ncbi:hypothetical protein EWM64_g1584 [Hericium alpestre]|uniref:Uncharacterized protein n=1 Tax=Hericium alpestre TaxID=135208 RepID=A0A4Z0A6R2_9AGAM|nr:hypothetical protein EWM64_g1584 [Hericium alpestre]
MASIAAQHPPAMRVGGRRMSIPSGKPKPNVASEGNAPSPGEPADYPRPAPPTDAPAPHTNNEEEAPKKEKKQGRGSPDMEWRFRESAQRKAEENRPRRDGFGGKANVGGGGRISQPAQKTFGI